MFDSNVDYLTGVRRLLRSLEIPLEYLKDYQVQILTDCGPMWGPMIIDVIERRQGQRELVFEQWIAPQNCVVRGYQLLDEDDNVVSLTMEATPLHMSRSDRRQLYLHLSVKGGDEPCR